MGKIYSIIQSDMECCYICGANNWLEYHHIFNKYNRKKSEEDGLVVRLCHFCHNEPPYGIHHNRKANEKLKSEAQQTYMKHYNKTVEEFRARYGKNYIQL